MRQSIWWPVCSSFLLSMTSSALAEDPKPPCTPQPTCEFSELIIKPGAPTPGLKPQDNVVPGLKIQGLQPSDLRNSYRLPNMALER